MDLHRKYLLSSVAFAPNDGRGSGGAARPRVTEAFDDNQEAGDGGLDNGADGEFDDDLDAGDDGADVGGVADDTDDTDGSATEVDEPEDDGADLEAAPRRPRSREQRRIETLANTNRELREQAAASERRLAALEASLNQPRQTVDPRDEEARIALMSPEERMNYRVDSALRTNQQQTQGALAAMQEQADQTAFRALLRDKPHLSRFKDKVEARAKELRGKGTPLPREAILIYIIGETAYSSEQKPQKRSQSQQRMAQQQTRPARAGGDVRTDRRQAAGNNSLERRLANVSI